MKCECGCLEEHHDSTGVCRADRLCLCCGLKLYEPPEFKRTVGEFKVGDKVRAPTLECECGHEKSDHTEMFGACSKDFCSCREFETEVEIEAL